VSGFPQPLCCCLILVLKAIQVSSTIIPVAHYSNIITCSTLEVPAQALDSAGIHSSSSSLQVVADLPGEKGE
jgi:hypothetical protein